MTKQEGIGRHKTAIYQDDNGNMWSFERTTKCVCEAKREAGEDVACFIYGKGTEVRS